MTGPIFMTIYGPFFPERATAPARLCMSDPEDSDSTPASPIATGIKNLAAISESSALSQSGDTADRQEAKEGRHTRADRQNTGNECFCIEMR